MGAPAQTLRIRSQLSVKQVNWQLVFSILCNNFRVQEEQARKCIASFIESFSEPLSVRWVRGASLSDEERQLLLALCEAHGADIVTLTADRELHLGPIAVSYRHSIIFELSRPEPNAERALTVGTPAYSLSTLGRTVSLSTLSAVVFARVGMLLGGALLTAFLLGLFIYGTAIAVLFLLDPAYMTYAATQKASFGFALLCMLVGAAGIFGRAIANISTTLVAKLRHTR